jgi:hypothetical protein
MTVTIKYPIQTSKNGNNSKRRKRKKAKIN